jgi:hypothetical protein
MAQLTRETPIALQTEHHQPTEYFYKLVRDYETRMTAYSREIQKAEAAIGSIGGSPGVTAQGMHMPTITATHVQVPCSILYLLTSFLF